MIWVIIISLLYLLSIIQGVNYKFEAVISKFVRASIGSWHYMLGPLAHKGISAVVGLFFVFFMYEAEIRRESFCVGLVFCCRC